MGQLWNYYNKTKTARDTRDPRRMGSRAQARVGQATEPFTVMGEGCCWEAAKSISKWGMKIHYS